MTNRSLALALVATLALSSVSFAQARTNVPRLHARAPAPTFGSVERTKLLSQVRGSLNDDLLLLGSVERRAILTGAHVQQLRKQPRSARRY